MINYTKTNQVGKKKQSRTDINKIANKNLAELWRDFGIDACEICGSNIWLTNMHRHKRVWFYDKPDYYLWDWKYCIRACMKCHQRYEYDKKATEEVFIKLRGNELLTP